MNSDFILGVLVLASFVEGMTEYTLGPVEGAKPYIKYVALVFGIIVAVGYNIDILSSLGIATTKPFIGNIFSGLIIGRGSNYVNDFVSMLKKPVA